MAAEIWGGLRRLRGWPAIVSPSAGRKRRLCADRNDQRPRGSFRVSSRWSPSSARPGHLPKRETRTARGPRVAAPPIRGHDTQFPTRSWPRRSGGWRRESLEKGREALFLSSANPRIHKRGGSIAAQFFQFRPEAPDVVLAHDHDRHFEKAAGGQHRLVAPRQTGQDPDRFVTVLIRLLTHGAMHVAILDPLQRGV